MKQVTDIVFLIFHRSGQETIHLNSSCSTEALPGTKNWETATHGRNPWTQKA